MSENNNKKFKLVYLLYGLALFLVVSVVSFATFKPVKVLPRISIAPGYAFVNHDNESRTSEDYRGKLTLYNFTYTNCDGDCPNTTKDMQGLRAAIEAEAVEGMQYALVTVTLDPERDTPEALNSFAAPYLGTEESSVTWDFITGDPLKVRYMVGGGFSLFYETEASQNSADDYEVKFYPYYVLVDGWGIIRAEYPTANIDYDEVVSDIKYLTTEINNSEGAARYAYEAAHLFRCYP